MLALGGEQARQWQHGPHHQGVGPVHLSELVLHSLQGHHGGAHRHCEVRADGPGQGQGHLWVLRHHSKSVGVKDWYLHENLARALSPSAGNTGSG